MSREKKRQLLAIALGFTLAGSAAGATEQTLLDVAGVWQMRGYGRLFDISATGLVEHDTTDMSCVVRDERTLEQAAAKYDRIARDGDRMSLFETGGITRYTFDLIAGVPDSCRDLDPQASSSERVFDVFTRAFAENYAFFELHDVDWPVLSARYRSELSAESDEDDLFRTLVSMIRALDDGHVVLEAGERFFHGGRVGELREMWLAAAGAADWPSERLGYEEAVENFVTDEVMHGDAKVGANGTLDWGFTAPGIGYLGVMSMSLPPAKGAGDLKLPEQLALVDRAMTQAMADLKGARVLIVDARFNDGGYDSVALAIMGYLTAERFLAFTKRAVYGGGFTTLQKIYVEPRTAAPFTGPIFYLQSGSTVSAAEIFTLAMMARPHTTRVGTRTYGVFSDELEKVLPNGWRVTLSNELYTAADGNIYESVGIPPDVRVSARSFRDRLRKDIDTALRRAGEIP